jgi:hypothetical protein
MALLAFINLMVLYVANEDQPDLLSLSKKLKSFVWGSTTIVAIIFGVMITHKEQKEQTPPHESWGVFYYHKYFFTLLDLT